MKTRRAGGSWRVLAGLLATFAVAVPLLAQKPGEKYALVAGSVFRENGMSLAGAEVSLEPSKDTKETRKLKKQKFITDARGEFAVRVPADPMDYKVIVSARGYQTQDKSVTIAGEDRVDVFFHMEAASK